MSEPAGLIDWDADTPWLPGDQQLLAQPGTAVAAAASVAFNANVIARSSYLVFLAALFPAAATLPFVQADMFWADPAGTPVLAHEKWIIPGTSTSPAASNSPVTGRGPSKTALLNVNITNLDPAQAATVDFYLYQSTRDISRDDWRSLGLGAIPSFTNAASECASLLTGFKFSASLAAGAQINRVTGLYSGPAQFALQQSAAQSLLWNIVAIDPNFTSVQWPVVAGSVTPAEVFTEAVTLPRVPCEVIIQNNGASATNVQWALTAQEQAS